MSTNFTITSYNYLFCNILFNNLTGLIRHSVVAVNDAEERRRLDSGLLQLGGADPHRGNRGRLLLLPQEAPQARGRRWGRGPGGTPQQARGGTGEEVQTERLSEPEDALDIDEDLGVSLWCRKIVSTYLSCILDSSNTGGSMHKWYKFCIFFGCVRCSILF